MFELSPNASIVSLLGSARSSIVLTTQSLFILPLFSLPISRPMPKKVRTYIRQEAF
jgi:hypothetical protein